MKGAATWVARRVRGWQSLCILEGLGSWAAAKRGQNGLPTAQQAEKKRKERWSVYLGSAGQSEARHREKGGKLGEVGEWQCEVRWGARRVVARREQGAVGNVSRREWGDFESVITNSILEEKEGEIPESASYIGEHLNSYPPAARNQPSWVLILR